MWCSHGSVTSCLQSDCKHQRKEKLCVISCAELNKPWNYQQRTVDLSTTLYLYIFLVPQSSTLKLEVGGFSCLQDYMASQPQVITIWVTHILTGRDIVYSIYHTPYVTDVIFVSYVKAFEVTHFMVASMYCRMNRCVFELLTQFCL
jgi:hypothetical protein